MNSLNRGSTGLDTILYISDPPSIYDGVVVQMYADDTVLHAHGKDAALVATLTP